MDKECCPQFDPKKWDEKEHKWKGKTFIKETIRTFFHIPFPPSIGKKITKMWKMAESAKKTEANQQNILVLFHDPSAFKSEIYLSVAGSVPDANNVELSGHFISRVFDGPYNAMPKFIKEMKIWLEKKGKQPKDYYVHYAYCPKCAKKFGHNYAVLFAQI